MKVGCKILILINSSPMMKSKWLFDIGDGLTCMSLQQFRQIYIKKRLSKLNLNQKQARGDSGTAIIPDVDFLFPM
jgi:hypothetical protein